MISKNIFLISNEPWGDLWFSKHHYANELALLGYTVYYINAPPKWNIKALFNWEITQNRINKNLTIVNYKNPFPLRILPMLFSRINDFLNRWKIIRQINLKEEAITWTFDPLRFSFFPLTKEIIYHVADPYMSSVIINKYDEVLFKKANIIVCTSPNYKNYYIEKGASNVITIKHKISRNEFKIDDCEVKKIKNLYGDFILLIGTLNDDIEYNLIEEVNSKINTNLVFIGKDSPTKQLNKRITLNNRFHNIGVIHAHKLKNYIYASTVCLTVYKFNLSKGGGVRSPLKTLNYLAQAKPIITSIDSEIPELLNCAIYRARSNEEFLTLVRKGLANSLFINKKAISEYLNKNSYEQAISEILNHLIKNR